MDTLRHGNINGNFRAFINNIQKIFILIVVRKRAFQIKIKPLKQLGDSDKVSRFGPIKSRLTLTLYLTLGYNWFDVFNRIGKITAANKICQSCNTWMA